MMGGPISYLGVEFVWLGVGLRSGLSRDIGIGRAMHEVIGRTERR